MNRSTNNVYAALTMVTISLFNINLLTKIYIHCNDYNCNWFLRNYILFFWYSTVTITCIDLVYASLSFFAIVK